MELDVKRRKADPDLRQIKEKRIKKTEKENLYSMLTPAIPYPTT